MHSSAGTKAAGERSLRFNLHVGCRIANYQSIAAERNLQGTVCCCHAGHFLNDPCMGKHCRQRALCYDIMIDLLWFFAFIGYDDQIPEIASLQETGPIIKGAKD